MTGDQWFSLLSQILPGICGAATLAIPIIVGAVAIWLKAQATYQEALAANLQAKINSVKTDAVSKDLAVNTLITQQVHTAVATGSKIPEEKKS